MTKGLPKALLSATYNVLTGRKLWNSHGEDIYDKSYVFVVAHPDDELPFLPTLKKAHSNPKVKTEFILTTNGTQGYEPQTHTGMTREEFGIARVRELEKSLRGTNFRGIPPNALADERAIYEGLLSDNPFITLHPIFNDIVDGITKSLEKAKPSFVFVNDFAGGHIIHDLTSALTCVAVDRYNRETNSNTGILEYWQPYLDVKEGVEQGEILDAIREYLNTGEVPEVAVQEIGELSTSLQGRSILEGDIHGRYPYNIPTLGIRKGVAAYGPVDLLITDKHRKQVYTTQGKSLNRLRDLTEISSKISRPRFRPIDLDEIDHTKKPAELLLYEVAGLWRVRGLVRNPDFNDFKRALMSYPPYQSFLQDNSGGSSFE